MSYAVTHLIRMGIYRALLSLSFELMTSGGSPHLLLKTISPDKPSWTTIRLLRIPVCCGSVSLSWLSVLLWLRTLTQIVIMVQERVLPEIVYMDHRGECWTRPFRERPCQMDIAPTCVIGNTMTRSILVTANHGQRKSFISQW
ncbi:hypothetical protein KP79_PYT15520 [Mizuhopecten yessoensis]|uniref:Uncharacterized protein n=1 Tax=Mizuhopecten yessoensis TaxID=6573 RepID=A0A210Q2X2_MIZYE|nr:hypothetical protein KP79_PYT15520 [Mizuhopecten yessoensis]